MANLDFSFERNGVGLSEWLWRLVSDDRSTRVAAGEALSAMQSALPTMQTRWEDIEFLADLSAFCDSHQSSFARAIRDAVVAPGFDTANYVRRLCIFCVVADEDWDRCTAEWNEAQRPKDEQIDRVLDRIGVTIDAAHSKEAREQAMHRLTRAIGAALCSAGKTAYTASKQVREESLLVGFVSTVFGMLDVALLAAPEALHMFLDNRRRADDGYAALTRIGPGAIDFIPFLFEKLDSSAETNGYDRRISDAIGSVGRGNDHVVEMLILRLQSSNAAIRHLAARSIAKMGLNVAGRQAEILAHLRSLRNDEQDLYATIEATASVGRNDAAARRWVIEQSLDRPAEWVAYPSYPTEKYNQTMHIRSAAIDAMEHFADYPDECLPSLIDALTSFEEYDPDEEQCGGRCSRVASVLADFGPAAAPAVDALIDQLQQDHEGMLPNAILDALAAIGPAALPAVDILLKQRDIYHDEPEPLDEASGSREVDPYGWTIAAIRGKPIV